MTRGSSSPDIFVKGTVYTLGDPDSSKVVTRVTEELYRLVHLSRPTIAWTEDAALPVCLWEWWTYCYL